MKTPATPCRSRRTILPNCNASLISDASASAGAESIPRLQGSERNAHSCRSFRPKVPGSTSVVPAAKRHFFRTVFDADRIGVCAMASPNFPEKGHRKTRGCASCSAPATLPQMNLRPAPAFSFRQWRPAGLAGIAEHVRHAAFETFQQKLQGFQCDVLLAHFHSMKR